MHHIRSSPHVVVVVVVTAADLFVLVGSCLATWKGGNIFFEASFRTMSKGALAVNGGDDVSLSSETNLLPLYVNRAGPSSRSSAIRILISCILLASLIFVVVDSFTGKRVESTAVAFFGWVEAHPFLGVLSVVLVYMLATSTFKTSVPHNTLFRMFALIIPN